MGWIPVQLKTFTVKNLVSISILILGFLFHSPISTPVKSRDWYGLVDTAEYDKQKSCLVSVLYHEARSESEEGIKAVLSVIKNRKNAKGFPSSFCGVVHEPRQFSFRNNLLPGQKMLVKPLKALDKEKYTLISSLADDALVGRFKPTLEPSVLYYAKVDVKKPWMKKLKVVAVIENHKFYSI